MPHEFEWDGCALQAAFGIAESLHAAGIDDAVPEHGPVGSPGNAHEETTD